MTREQDDSRVATLEAGSGRLRIAPDGLTFTGGGADWALQGPLFVVHLYDRRHPRREQCAIPCESAVSLGTPGTISYGARSSLTVEPLDGRTACVHVRIENLLLEIDVQVALDPDGLGFRVTLPADAVREGNPDLYRLLAIEILPQFGAARTGEDGYLVLPNWCGCITRFDKDYPREIWQTVYSSNDQWEQVCNMGLFGIARAGGTLCGIITAGDMDAQLVCRSHWERAQLNSVHAALVYRWEQQDPLVAGPREIAYRVTPSGWDGGEGYLFCGREYRRFLRARRGLLTWDEKRTERPAAVDYAGRYFLKIFMANKTPQADGRGDYRCCCTFDEARAILEDCRRRGITRLTAVLTGWGLDGHDGRYPSRFPVDERLGGEAGLKRLLVWCRETDILLSVHDGYGASYACSPEHDPADLVRHRSGERWQSIVWSGGQCNQLCPAVALRKYVRRDMPALRELGIAGHLHIDAVGSFMPCFDPAHPLTERAQVIEQVRGMFQTAIQELGSVSTEMPFGPYFDVVDGFFHSYSHPYAWHMASPMGRFFFDRSVPLVPAVVNGSLHCCEALGPGDNWLRLLDFGLSPQSEVCTRRSPEFGIAEYATMADRLEQGYARFYGPGGFDSLIGGREMTGRWDHTPGVSETRYDNGVRVLVNRGDTAWEDVAPRTAVCRKS